MTEHLTGVFHETVDGFNYTAGFCKSSLERVPTKVNWSWLAESLRDQTLARRDEIIQISIKFEKHRKNEETKKENGNTNGNLG